MRHCATAWRPPTVSWQVSRPMSNAATHWSTKPTPCEGGPYDDRVCCRGAACCDPQADGDFTARTVTLRWLRRSCEACGGALTPTAAGPSDEPEEMAAPIEITRSIQTDTDNQDTVVVARPCANCGGVIGADGHCETCGTKAPTERDHYTEQPASWVAACCDRGVRHHRNEDATAVAAEPALGPSRC